MDTTGSIKASLKGGNTGFHPQNIEPAVLERAKQFLESFQFDLRSRQILYADKMEVSLFLICSGIHDWFLSTKQGSKLYQANLALFFP